MTFVKYSDLSPREIVIRHACRRGGQRSNSFMSREAYDGIMEEIRKRQADMTSSLGQRGYSIAFRGTNLVAVWSDEHDCIVTFMIPPHPNWTPVRPMASTALAAAFERATKGRS